VLVSTALVIVPSSASARTFSYGVSATEVTSTSALLWARALKAGKVRLVVALNSRMTRRRITKTTFARRSNDLTVQTRVAGLIPARRYYYFFIQGRQRSVLGTFRTAPRPRASETIRFAVTGDTDGARTSDGTPYWNRDGSASFATYRAMTREQNHFNVNLGDTIYSESPDGTTLPQAMTLDLKRQKYRQNLGYPNLQGLRRSGVVYNQWDDHEFINDFTPASQACDVGGVFGSQYACNVKGLHTSGRKAFREYMPVTYSARNGSYRSFRWGRNLELFILDERSFRSIRASEVKDNPSAPEPTTHVCENPKGSGQDDPAPQIPQRIRDLFAFLYAPASNPARPECLAALNDPNRTMLGTSQYDRFTTAVKNSPAKWKVVINSVPLMEIGLNPYDSWRGYAHERERLLNFLKSNVKNVVSVTTDFHTNWVNDARIKTYPEDGGPVESGIMEFVAGGVADHLFGHEIDAFTGSKDSWKLLESAFLMRPPPDGPGMQCSNMVTYGYVQVAASAKTLTVSMKDNQGKQISNAQDGKPCGPYRLVAR
jgi:alkaline phosphatase D